MRAGRARSWAPVLCLAGLVLILFRDAVFSGRVFFQRDVHLMWHTQVETFVRSVAAGAWPAWNPFLAFGQPLWADANTQVAYPPTWLNLVLRPWRYYTLYVVAHFFGGAVGIYALGRRLGLSRAAALVAGAVWATSGPVVSAAPMWNQLAGAAWLPWAMLAADVALETGRRAHALLWGAALAAPILAGSPEAALMAGLLTMGLAVVAALARDRAPVPRRRILASSSLAIAFALALSAAQWLPTLEAARRSGRASLPAGARTSWSVHPLVLLQVLFPVFIDPPGLRPDRAAVLFDSREPFFASLYLGLTAAGLVLAAGAGPARRQRGLLAAAAVAAVLMALGRHTPGYEVAVAVLPPLRALRYPAKAMALVAFAWAVLAGMGFDAWHARGAEDRRLRRRVLVPLAGLTVLAGLATLLVLRDPDGWGTALLSSPPPGLSYAELLAPTRWRLVVATLSSTAALAVGGLARRLPASTRAPALAACAIADLFLAHQGMNPTAPPALYTHRPELIDVVRSLDGARVYSYDYFFPGRSRRYLGRPVPYLVTRAPESWPARAAQALGMRLCLFPPTPGPWGVEGSYDLDVPGLGSPHVARLVEQLRAAEGTPDHVRLLRLGAVGHVVALHAVGFEGLEPVATEAGLFPEPIRVFRVPDPVPRTYVVGDTRVTDGAEALRLVVDPTFDPAREVVLSEGVAVRAGPSFTGTSRVMAREANHVRLEADLSGAGYVVLVDAWDPAWHAWVDGQPAPVRRANVAFQAVPLPAGRHIVELRYRPGMLPWGLAISALAGAALLTVVFSPLRSGRWGQHPPAH